jgi:putative ABC transport system permease protein
VIYLIQTSLISQIVKSAPVDFPNIFLLGITDQDKSVLSDFMNSRAGIEAHALVPLINARLVRIDGKTLEQLETDPRTRRRMRGEFTLTWSEKIPPDTRIVEGQWWEPPFDLPRISVLEYAAQRFKIGIGSVLEFDIGGGVVRGTVANIRDAEFSRPGTSSQFVFSPGALRGFPASYVGTVRIPPSQAAAFQGDVFRRFPNITSIDVGQVLAKVQELLDKVSTVIRFIAFFAILSGVVILASSVVSTRLQRIREAALLKTLGATRSQLVRIQSVEFLIIGTAAGFIGSVLAAIAAHYLLGNLLDTEFDFRWAPLLACTVTTAVLAIATGWMASRGVLKHRPLEILREN